jgi:CBS domain-containing protein
MLARDIMTRDVCTVGLDTPVEDVARRLVERRITPVPVGDPENIVIGNVSQGDLLRRRETGTERHRSWLLQVIVDPDSLAREYVKARGLKAHDVMTRRVITVREETPVAQIADIFERNHIKRVPVTHSGKLVGIVTRGDLVRAFLAATKSAAGEPRSPDDARIAAELSARMAREPWAESLYVQSCVNDGIVEFWGLARSDEHRDALRVLAETIPGVKRVDERLKLATSIF